MTESLLPPSASKQERDVEAAVARIGDVEPANRSVWNPDQAPPAILPWFGWGLSVDVWDAAWSDQVKRNVIKESFAVHRTKGTKGALRRAIEALEFDLILIREWFEYGGDPFTFQVYVGLFSRGLTEHEFATLLDVILSTKNTRSHLDHLRIYVQAAGKVPTIRTVALSSETTTVYPYAVTEIEQRDDIPRLGAAEYGVDRTTIYPN